jgi:Flp pilus assembly protein CpaB
MNYSVRNLVIAAGLALCAIILVLVYTSNVQKKAEDGQTLTTVLVAGADIKPGTTFAQVKSGNLLRPQEVRVTDRLAGSVTAATLNGTSLDDMIVQQTVYAGQQVPLAVFQATVSAEVDTQLQRNQRAIELDFEGPTGLSDTLASGDHVDVLVAIRITKQDGTESGVVRRLLTDVQVLKAPGGEDGADTANVLLKVSDSQAAKLLWAKQFGTALQLVLRPKARAENGAVQAQTIDSVLLDGLNDKQLADLVKKSQITAK